MSGNYRKLLKEEAKAFDKQIKKRIKIGFVPDLRKNKFLKNFYNNIWREKKFVKIHWGQIINQIINLSKKNGKNVLEIGCGSGFLCLELARNKLDVTGIDVSSKSIKSAKEYKNKLNEKLNLNYIAMDANDVVKIKKRYSSIIFFRSLHHFKDYKKIINLSYKILEKNGQLIIFEPFRKNFSIEAATYSFLIRNLVDNFSGKKNKKKFSIRSIDKEVNSIYYEYKYETKSKKKKQSPFDNSIDDISKVKKALKKIKKVKVTPLDTISDKILGGLRGKRRHEIATLIKLFDSYLNKINILKATNYIIVAKKN